MIYISTAIYYEAESLIKFFCLKKNKNISFADVFENSEITLIISGVGGINSAINIARLLACRKISESDAFINIGICGCSNQDIKIGEIFLINKIKSFYTGKCFYPDIVYKHNFKESSVETFAHPVFENKSECTLFDMESAEIFIAVSQFFKLHRIFIIKIVSDYGSPQSVTKDLINKITNNSEIFSFIKSFANIKKENLSEEISYKYTNLLSEKLNLTETMKNDLHKLITYHLLCGKDISVLNDFSDIEVNSKNDAKKYFSQIKSLLLS